MNALTPSLISADALLAQAPGVEDKRTKFENRATAEPKWGMVNSGREFKFLVYFYFCLCGGILRSLRQGFSVYWHALIDPDALSAIKLTLLAAAICAAT